MNVFANRWGMLAFGLGLFTSSAFAELIVVSVQPARHTLTAPLMTPISVTFDRPVNTATATAQTFRVFGRWTGTATGTFSFSNGNQTVTLTPSGRFQPGDTVTVTLTRNLQAADATFLRNAGYSWQFWTRSRPAPMVFTEIDEFSNRIDNAQTRIYGAMAADLNNDGFCDLTTVNEVSSDVRTFLNAADGMGLFDPMLAPFPISFEASPNESADFNNDGNADMCAAASGTSTVWILLGDGAGLFIPPGQEIPVGDQPHGIAILDMDGDGDMDIATANTGGDNISLLFNTGAGLFGAASSFDAGCSGEYGLASGDFNNDGILDLAAGCRFSQDVRVLRGNGNGTFTAQPAFAAGGLVWMLAAGDVNGDGNLDLSSANSQSGNGAILLGNGMSGFAPPATDPVPGGPIATDLGDLDGDGDLDWLLSSFSGSIWYLYANNGTGSFTFDQQFPANNNPSCAILLDLDGDRDLDVALTDEIADVITLQRNGGTARLADFDDDNDVDGDDFTDFEACFTGPGIPYAAGCFAGDIEGDGDIDCEDYAGFQDSWTEAGQAPDLAACAAGVVPAMGFKGLATLLVLFAFAGSFVVLRRQVGNCSMTR